MGPLATAWQSNTFLSPSTDRAVPACLHLNDCKIGHPTIRARIEPDELDPRRRGSSSHANGGVLLRDLLRRPTSDSYGHGVAQGRDWVWQG